MVSFPHWFSYRLVSSIYLIFWLALLRLLVRRQDKRKLEPDTAACSLSCHKRQIPPLASHLIRNLLLLISLQIARLEFLVDNESIRAEFWIILACYSIELLSHCPRVIFNHIGCTVFFFFKDIDCFYGFELNSVLWIFFCSRCNDENFACEP